jgi:ABC-2 type transport system ATP-binding protein
MKAAIQIEGLSKHFGRIEALIDVNLDVPEGAIYALIGPNGAGKTTIVKTLMNIIPPTSGKVSVLGSDSKYISGRAFNRIGYVSENQETPDWMKVGQMLDYLRPFYPLWERALEQQLVQQFNLPLDRHLQHLSRGMKMKLSFAGSLAYRPQLIVLDEPFSGLDPLVRDELIECLIDRAPETTMFLSSHDLAEIENIASHVGYLDRGRLLFSEEMSSVSARFREVTIALEGKTALPKQLPSEWLRIETSGPVVQFVHTNFRGDHTRDEISKVFTNAREIAFDPMPLRAIFLAVAKTSRTHGRSTIHTTPEGVGA